MTSPPGTISEGVARIKELTLAIVEEFGRRVPAILFIEDAKTNSPAYPAIADMGRFATLFPTAPRDVWEDHALDYIKEFYIEVVNYFLKTERKRRTENEVHRFFAITLLCGPHRAIEARNNSDDLWEGGVPQGAADRQSQTRYSHPANNEAQFYMEDVISLFYDVFRTEPGDYDHRNPKPQTVWQELLDSKDARLDDLTNQGIVNPSIDDVFGPAKGQAAFITLCQTANQRFQVEQNRKKAARDLADRMAQQAAQQAAQQQAQQQAQQAAQQQAHQLAHQQAAAAHQAAMATTSMATRLPVASASTTADVLINLQTQFGYTPDQLQRALANALRHQASNIGPPPLPSRQPIFNPPTTSAPAVAPRATLHPSLAGLAPASAVAAPMATPVTSSPAAPTRYYTQQYDPSTGTYIYTGVGTTPVGAPISHVDPSPYTPRPPQMTQVIAPGVGRVAIPQPHGFPLRVREQVIQPNTSLDATIRTMSSHGVPPSDPGALMAIGMASGVAEGIGNIVRNKKGPVYVTREVVQNIEQNCKVDNFDFNIYGLTTAEILGTRFSNTTFQSEEARVTVA